MSGSTCHQAVAYPIVTGELNVSLMDYTSRRIRGYKPEDLLASVPYHRFHGIMRSIEHCTAGRARMEVPESFRRLAGAEALSDLEEWFQFLQDEFVGTMKGNPKTVEGEIGEALEFNSSGDLVRVPNEASFQSSDQ